MRLSCLRKNLFLFLRMCQTKIVIDSLHMAGCPLLAGSAPPRAVGEGCTALQDTFLTRMRCLLPTSLNVRSLQSYLHTPLQLFNRAAAKGLRAHFEQSLLVHKGVHRGLVSAQPGEFHTHGLLRTYLLLKIYRKREQTGQGISRYP